MTIEIYGELVLGIYIAMHYCILKQVSLFTKSTSTTKKKLFSSIFMAFVGVFMLYIPGGDFLKVFIPGILVLLAFGKANRKIFLRQCVMAYIQTLFLSALSMLLLKLSSSLVVHVFLSLFTFIAGGKLIYEIYDSFFARGRKIVEIDILLHDKKVTVYALLDTGHSLVDPISKKPVLLCELRAIEEILPWELSLLYAQEETDNLEKLLKVITKGQLESRFRFIPYQTVSEKDMLCGFVPDAICIENEKIDGVIGIITNTLSNGHAYNALISEEMSKQHLQ